MKVPPLKDISLKGLDDPRVLKHILFNLCSQAVGTNPSWAPHLEFRRLYAEAQKEIEEMDKNPCMTGLIDPRIPQAYAQAGVDVTPPDFRPIERQEPDGSWKQVRMIEIEASNRFRYQDTPEIIYCADTDGEWADDHINVGRVYARVVETRDSIVPRRLEE